MSKINLDLSKLNTAITNAFDVAVEAQGEAFQQAITAEVWEWPRETVRRNGETVDSPRDIVDTGELHDSLVVARSANAAEYTWDVDYATIVHDGATTLAGTELPARPWTELGLQECNAFVIMQQQLNKNL